MRLKTLEVDGFKSFSKHTRLTFSAPISAIVGPNGSGKSNIAEAFRFVLGEQSMKSMRGKRGEDMIFNGSSSHNRSNRAHVKITLDNKDRLLDIDYDEVVIERIVHRDGANEYYLNGSTVRLKDIRELIAGAHIGSSGHHIISQGEADKLIEASPAGRKEMIEDALGLRIYQTKRLESIRKLERTRENIKETQTQRREVAPRLRELARVKEKIERVREMKQGLQTKALDYFAREHAQIQIQKQEGGDKRTPLEQKKQDLERELQAKRDQVEAAGEHDDQSTRLKEIDEQISGLNRERDELTRELGRIEGELSLHQRVIAQASKADEHNATRKVYLKHVEDTAEFIEARMKEAEEAGTLEKMREAFGAIRESLSNFIKANREERDDASVKEARAEIARLEGEQREITGKRDELDRRKKEAEQQYHDITNSVEERKDSTRDAERAIYELRTQLSSVTNDLERLDAQARALKDREEEMNQDLARIGQVVGRAVLDYKNHTPSEENMDRDEQSRRESRDEKQELERLLIRIEDNSVEESEEMMREYTDLVEKDQFLERELEDLEKSAASLEELIAELEETLEREFQIGLKKINDEFQKLFAHMFGGGTAKLMRVKAQPKENDQEGMEEGEPGERPTGEMDDEKPQEGVELSVNPPSKKIKGLQMLSGGERSLVSIALLFAMSYINPPPFIILDETDAALDEANAKKYGDLIAELASQSQLILITHNRETMSRAGVLYGVTMAGTGASTILSVAFEEAEQAVVG